AKIQSGDFGQSRSDLPFGVSHGAGDPIKLVELRQSHGARQFAHAAANAPELIAFVGGIEPAGIVARITQVMDREAPLVEVLVVADDHAPFAAGDVLVELEAEDGDVAEGAS